MMHSNKNLSSYIAQGIATPLDTKTDSGFYIFKKWPSVKDYQKNKDLIFVFGSNLEGIHGAGAAKFAKDYLGAKLGIAEGLTGQTYALPTKNLMRKNIDVDQMNLVEQSIFNFFKYVLMNINSNQTYVLSAIGTGLSELSTEFIVETLLKTLSEFGENDENAAKTIKQHVIFPSEFQEEMLERICKTS